jgi:hypothetical protein
LPCLNPCASPIPIEVKWTVISTSPAASVPVPTMQSSAEVEE